MPTAETTTATETLPAVVLPSETTALAPAALARRTPVVAITQEQFSTARDRLMALCDANIAEHQQIATELAESIEHARRNKWRMGGMTRALANAKKTVVYYENARAALEAGYMLMPNLDADVFAVRVNTSGPGAVTESAPWATPVPTTTADKAIPAGEGRYVSDETAGEQWKEITKDEKGNERVRHYAMSTDYLPVEAPLVATRPVLLNAAAQAMALKVFDEIGIVGVNRRSRSGDPMLVGRIVHPARKGRRLSFFLAWWFNPEDL